MDRYVNIPLQKKSSPLFWGLIDKITDPNMPRNILSVSQSEIYVAKLLKYEVLESWMCIFENSCRWSALIGKLENKKNCSSKSDETLILTDSDCLPRIRLNPEHKFIFLKTVDLINILPKTSL